MHINFVSCINYLRKRERDRKLIEFVKELPMPYRVKDAIPVPANIAVMKEARDQELKDIITGKSDKFLLLIGPCSADNETAVLDYVCRLARVQEEVKDKILIVPRVYTNKPRTTGIGYKGMLHQPNPEEKPDLYAGLLAIRNIHIHVMQETGMTTADEMLYPENYWYLEDVLSYIAIGARSVEDQFHRMVAGGIDVPVGMKNPTSGSYDVMLNSIVAAQSKQDFIYRNWEVRHNGNPYAHAILRGGVNKHGQNFPNYHYEDLMTVNNLYHKRGLVNPAVIIDCNHSNSNKKYIEQIRIAQEVLHSRSHSDEVRELVKGLMIESYIEPGNQKVGDGVYGKSITDACLGWQQSEDLIYRIADKC